MLKAAQMYKDTLYSKFANILYDPKYIYYSYFAGNEIPQIPDNNYDRHCFVSVDDEGGVIGYIEYDINYTTMSAYNVSIISFETSVLFATDVYQAMIDIFETYNMNRLFFSCFADNPAIRSYRNFIKKHGGKECGYHRQVARLKDGKLHDDVEFEILRSEFRK